MQPQLGNRDDPAGQGGDDSGFSEDRPCLITAVAVMQEVARRLAHLALLQEGILANLVELRDRLKQILASDIFLAPAANNQ